jgi:hypothetical protein
MSNFIDKKNAGHVILHTEDDDCISMVSVERTGNDIDVTVTYQSTNDRYTVCTAIPLELARKLAAKINQLVTGDEV